MASCSANPPLW